VGFYRPGDACDNVAAELERYHELGFTDFTGASDSRCRSAPRIRHLVDRGAFPPDDITNDSLLAERSPTPIATGETPRDGHITLNQAPGIGIELDWEAVSHHAIAGTAGQR
jgi:hypothetical protein